MKIKKNKKNASLSVILTPLKVWKKPVFEALTINNPLDLFKAGCTPHGT